MRAYTFGLPKNSLKAIGNKVRLVSYNNPANIKQEIYLVFGKEQILGRFSESIKNAKNIIYNDLVTKEEEGFSEYLNKKKEREYFATILRKYLVASMYLVLCIPIIKYLIIILNVINSKLRIRGKEVKEKVNVGYLDNLDLVKAFIAENEVDIPYKIAPRRAGDIATCYADASKAKEVLGWVAEKNLNDMVRDSWNWQKKNPEGY